MKRSILNRWGVRLHVGDTVSVAHPRGGRNADTIKGFETTGAFVVAYGVRVLLVSGSTCSVDDCTPMADAIAALKARNLVNPALIALRYSCSKSVPIVEVVR